MKYQELVNVYEALGATTKRLEKTDILADFLIKVEEEDLEKITLMALGSVFPSWSEEEQGIGDKLVMKAVGDAVGVSVDAVEDAIRDEGDIGAAAEKLYAQAEDTSAFTEDKLSPAYLRRTQAEREREERLSKNHSREENYG